MWCVPKGMVTVKILCLPCIIPVACLFVPETSCGDFWLCIIIDQVFAMLRRGQHTQAVVFQVWNNFFCVKSVPRMVLAALYRIFWILSCPPPFFFLSLALLKFDAHSPSNGSLLKLYPRWSGGDSAYNRGNTVCLFFLSLGRERRNDLQQFVGGMLSLSAVVCLTLIRYQLYAYSAKLHL